MAREGKVQQRRISAHLRSPCTMPALCMLETAVATASAAAFWRSRDGGGLWLRKLSKVHHGTSRKSCAITKRVMSYKPRTTARACSCQPQGSGIGRAHACRRIPTCSTIHHPPGSRCALMKLGVRSSACNCLCTCTPGPGPQSDRGRETEGDRQRVEQKGPANNAGPNAASPCPQDKSAGVLLFPSSPAFARVCCCHP